MNSNKIEDQELADFFSKLPKHLQTLTDDEAVYEDGQLERQANAAAINAAYQLGRNHQLLWAEHQKTMISALREQRITIELNQKGWLRRLIGL